MGFLKASSRLRASPQTRLLPLFFAFSQLRVERVHSRSLANRTLVSPTRLYGRGRGWCRWRTVALQELGLGVLPGNRCFSSGATEAAVWEPRSSDGMTVDDIIGKGWPILDEAEGDWRSHAAAIAQSIHLIKRRLQVPAVAFFPSFILRMTHVFCFLKKNRFFGVLVFIIESFLICRNPGGSGCFISL